MSNRNNNYPLQLYAGLEYTRGFGDSSVHPYPQMIGAVSGLLPLFDVSSVYSRQSAGWGVNAGVYAARDVGAQVGNVTMPDLPKVKG